MMNQKLRITQKGFLPIILILGVILLFVWRSPAKIPSTLPEPGHLPIAAAKPKTTTILAVGDIMLSRNVAGKIEKAQNPNLPFENLQSLLGNADITFGNLECPLSDLAAPGGQGLVFRCPAKYDTAIKEAGFDILSTANNHSFDQGLDNLEFTSEYLKSQGILAAGTGNDFDEAHTAQTLTRNEIQFGFLAYSYSAHNDGGKSTHPQIATMNDLVRLRQDIAAARGHTADVIIVSMHAGTEYQRHPNADQTAFARAAIDAGADAVIGHHPHWIQDIEIYKGKPIFYSLGNFVFDQMWSEDTREGLMVRLAISDGRLEKAELIPIIIDSFCCPRLADENEKAKILKKINLETDTIIFDK